MRRGTECIAEAADHIAHGAPAFDVPGGEGANFGGAFLIVVPKLNAAAVEKGDEEAIDGGGPCVTAAGEIELFDHEGVEQAGKIGAGGHSYAGKGLFNGAGAANAVAAFDDQHALAGTCEIRGAGEAVMPGANDNRVPGFGGESGDRLGEADFAEQGGCGRTHAFHANILRYPGAWTPMGTDDFCGVARLKRNCALRLLLAGENIRCNKFL